MVTLLLISQLCLAPESSISRFTLDSNYGASGIAEPDSHNVDVSTPDILHFTSKQIEYPRALWFVANLFPVNIENHTSSYCIRAPPYIS